MQQCEVLCRSTSDFEDEVVITLQSYDSYIRFLAKKYMPRSTTLPGEPDLEIDDLAQNIRVKLWLAMKKGEITNVRAYLRSIAYTQAVDIARRHKRVHRLSFDQDGEIYRGIKVGVVNQEADDPADEYERGESLVGCLRKVVDVVLKLPPKQQRAMICDLKDQAADLQPLVEAFAAQGLDIEAIDWPAEKEEVQRLRASLCAARAKLRSQ